MEDELTYVYVSLYSYTKYIVYNEIIRQTTSKLEYFKHENRF